MEENRNQNIKSTVLNFSWPNNCTTWKLHKRAKDIVIFWVQYLSRDIFGSRDKMFKFPDIPGQPSFRESEKPTCEQCLLDSVVIEFCKC